MSEISKAIKHVNNAIFYIDMRVDKLESMLTLSAQSLNANILQRDDLTAQERSKIKEIKMQEAKKADLQRALAILQTWE